jgi:hypothetical protein
MGESACLNNFWIKKAEILAAEVSATTAHLGGAIVI